MKTLHAFISSRELEKTLPSKVAHLKAYEEKSELHFSDQMVATLWFRWEGKKSLAQITLWESGDCDSEILVTRDGSFLPHRYKRCISKEEFYEMLSEMVGAILKNETSA